MAIPPDKSPERINPGKPAESLDKPLTPGQSPTGFDSYMQGKGLPTSTPPATNSPTPMQVAGGPSFSTGGISFDSLLAQTKQTQDSLVSVQDQLNDKNLKLKRSQSHLVRQKLNDVNSYIRTAGAKLGVPLQEGKIPSGTSGISRFIAMVNDGQDQLMQVQAQLKKLSAEGGTINPGEMMSIQVKMGLAQQEISYTSTLLGKVIQSITQLMNTQL
jgi:hypothetical protein